MYRIASVEVTPGDVVRCLSPEGLAIHVEDRCVFDTNHVLEIGRIVSVVDAAEGATVPSEPMPNVIRCATLQDQARARENDLMGKMAMDSCETKAAALGLVMRLVSVRFSFDRKLLTVLYSAEDRVDFRALVKDLASEQHARIEMRQIGVRDEAGMIGGLGPCGRQQCCCSWLKKFESINVKMAKTQRLSLNPTAISGMCGRLKCCLRYENEQYREASRGMPREGSIIEGTDGRGCVIDYNTMGRTVRVRLEDDRILDYDVDDIRVLRPGHRH